MVLDVSNATELFFSLSYTLDIAGMHIQRCETLWHSTSFLPKSVLRSANPALLLPKQGAQDSNGQQTAGVNAAAATMREQIRSKVLLDRKQWYDFYLSFLISFGCSELVTLIH